MNLFKVTQTSFDKFDDTIKTYLQKMLGAMGIQHSNKQILYIIFNGIKGIMQNVMFYIEDAFTEQNIFTATRAKSLINLAKISGHEGYYGSAAVGTILCNLTINNGIINSSLASNKVNKLYIKNGSRIVNQTTGIQYMIDLPTDYYIIDVTKPLTQHQFKVIEGKYYNAQFVSKGYELESYEIQTQGLIDFDYINVYVNGEKYERVYNLYEMTENSKTYTLSTGYNSRFQIMFGNGVHGYIPNEGDVIQVTYLQHEGALGNISSNDNVKLQFFDHIYDGAGNQIDANSYLIIKQNGYISGGTYADTIQSIRANIGKNSRALVLASEDNFKLFFNRFSFIGQSNIWSEKNSMVITANLTQNMKDRIKSKEDYFSITNKDLLVTDDQKNIIKNVLYNSKRSFAGVTIKFVDPIIRRFAMVCYVKVDASINRQSLITDIQNSIAEFCMSIPYNTTFISKTDIIKKVLDDNKVIQFFDFTFISELAEQTYKDGYYFKNELIYVNGTYDYKKSKVLYEPDVSPGLDAFGNISVESKLEIPIIGGGFNYYTDKTSRSYIKTDAINIYFI